MAKPTIFFGYDSTYWKGLDRRGFLGPWRELQIGVRMLHSVFAPEEEKFNHRIHHDRALESALERYPRLMIDRAAGGIEYENYPWDLDAFRRLDGRLGQDFFGVQIHEYQRNTVSDWHKFLRKVPEVRNRPVTAADVETAFPSAAVPRPYTQYRAPEEFIGLTLPADETAFAAEIFENVRRIAQKAGGMFYGVECSARLSPAALAFQLGARAFLEEVGGQGYCTVMSIAAARGAGRAWARPWGVYYAPWFSNFWDHGETVTCYFKEGNLWRVQPRSPYATGWDYGGRGGPSRHLMMRLLYYSWLNGATLFSEEWGPENTFHDWQAFDLTPYGQTLLDFLRVMDDIGPVEPLAPVAMVYDPRNPVPEELSPKTDSPVFGLYEPDDVQRLRREFWNRLLRLSPLQPGREDQMLTDAVLPPAWDVVPADAPVETWSRYRHALWLNPNLPVPEALRRCGDVAVLQNASEAIELLRAWAGRDIPFRVESQGLWCVARTKRGWLLGLFNNHGISRNRELELIEDPAATATFKLSGAAATRTIWSWPEGNEVRPNRGGCEVTIAPGGLAVLEIKSQGAPEMET